MIFKRINNGNELYALFYENSHIRGRYTAFIRGKEAQLAVAFKRVFRSIPISLLLRKQLERMG